MGLYQMRFVSLWDLQELGPMEEVSTLQSEKIISDFPDLHSNLNQILAR